MAVSMSRPTMIAPAIGAANPTSPTTSTSRISPARTTVVVSPTASPERSRAALSSVISPGPVGSRPSAIQIAVSSGARPMPKLGGPLLITAVPSVPTRTIEPLTSGTNADTYLRGSTIEATGGDAMTGFAGAARFPIEIVDAIAEADGVAGVVPDVSGSIVLVGTDGTAVMSSGPPSFGMGLAPDDTAIWMADGREPTGPGEIALESAALERSGLAVGDTTTVVLAGEIREVEAVGEVGFAAPMAGAIMVGLDMETAMAAYAPDGTVDLVGVYAEDGVSQTDLATSVKATLAGVPGMDVEVLTGDQMRDDGREQWQSSRIW